MREPERCVHGGRGDVQAEDVEFGFVSGVHDGAIGDINGDELGRKVFVDDRGIKSAEVSSASSVSLQWQHWRMM